MKKIMLFASALAGLFLAASCQQENLEPVMSGNTVTYTVQVADAVATKVIGNDVTAVNELVYEVYRTVGERETQFTEDVDNLLYHKTAEIKDGVAKIDLEFVNDQNFTVLFWAQTRNNGVYDVADLTDVKILNQDVTNLENTAVFVGRDFVRDCVSEKNGKVTLVRPVSQINIGTTAESLDIEGQTDVVLEGSTVKVKGLATTYNIATLSATGNATTEYAATYTERPVPLGDLTLAAGTYEYVAMNYVGFASNEGSTITVSYIINTTEGNIENEIENVPVKPNYRTNIIGNLITSKADYTITLDKQWYDPNGGNIEVIEEGLIKNVNGDYEISEAKGLAYAMNNLFVAGGNFYLTAAEYDLRGFNVTAPTIPNGVTLNIYGETPVVTRAATTFAGITIIGLPEVNGTPALIEVVEDGGTVAVSGVTLQDEGSVIVSNNEGTLVVTESEVGADSYVAVGKDPVEAESVKSFADLKTALASEVVTAIDLAADIEATEALEINRSITINGNGKKLTSSASRVVNFTAPEIVVEFNDWAFVSTAARNGQNGPRGLNIWGPEVHDAELTFNRCSVDFTHETANDWTYAVNCGVNQNNTITINGGTYEGANVVNVWGESHTINISDATLTSLYPANNQYYGYCVSLQEATGCTLTMTNNTFNGSNAKPYVENDQNNSVVAENNTDNTMYYRDSEDGAVYFVSSAEKLQNAINMAKPETSVITFTNDIEGNVTILQKVGVNLVIDGDGHKFDGTFYLEGGNQGNSAETLTFRDIAFNHTGDTDFYFINANSAEPGKRYVHNVTVDNCTFTGDSRVAAMIYRQSYNMTVSNSEATGLHSLVQAYGTIGLTIDAVTVNASRGVSLGSSTNVLIKDSEFIVNSYGIRGNGDGGQYNTNISVVNSTIAANQPIVIRKVTDVNHTYAVALDNVNLQTEELYQVVFTNGADDEEYHKPTGKWSLSDEDNWEVFPAPVEVASWDEFAAALDADATKVKLTADIEYASNYQLQKSVKIDLNEYAMTLPMINIHTKTTIKNGTINGKVYARKNAEIVFDRVTFSGAVADNLSTEGHLAIQGGCKSLYAKDCLFSPTSVSGSQTKPLSFEGGSTQMKFENCEFKSSPYKKQVYLNPLSATGSLEFTGCNFNNKTPNIMFAANCPLTNITMSGTTNLSSVTFEINRAKDVVTDADLAHLRTLIANNSFSSVRVFYAGGSSEYIR